jgi:CBS domain-containing protein
MERSLKVVSDIMKSGVISISETTSLKATARVMHEHQVHGVLVVADDGELLGWVTALGVLRHREADWRRLKAGEAISEPCVSVAPSATVPSAIDVLLDAGVTRLLVLRPGSRTPDGVVSDADLVAYLSR